MERGTLTNNYSLQKITTLFITKGTILQIMLCGTPKILVQWDWTISSQEGKGKHAERVADFYTKREPNCCLGFKESSVEDFLIFMSCIIGFQIKRNLKGWREHDNLWCFRLHHFPTCMNIDSIPTQSYIPQQLLIFLHVSSEVHWESLFTLVFLETWASLTWKPF